MTLQEINFRLLFRWLNCGIWITVSYFGYVVMVGMKIYDIGTSMKNYDIGTSLFWREGNMFNLAFG